MLQQYCNKKQYCHKFNGNFKKGPHPKKFFWKQESLLSMIVKMSSDVSLVKRETVYHLEEQGPVPNLLLYAAGNAANQPRPDCSHIETGLTFELEKL